MFTLHAYWIWTVWLEKPSGSVKIKMTIFCSKWLYIVHSYPWISIIDESFFGWQIINNTIFNKVSNTLPNLLFIIEAWMESLTWNLFLASARLQQCMQMFISNATWFTKHTNHISENKLYYLSGLLFYYEVDPIFSRINFDYICIIMMLGLISVCN